MITQAITCTDTDNKNQQQKKIKQTNTETQITTINYPQINPILTKKRLKHTQPNYSQYKTINLVLVPGNELGLFYSFRNRYASERSHVTYTIKPNNIRAQAHVCLKPKQPTATLEHRN